MFSDQQTLKTTVASTSETALGSINVPAGSAYRITSLFCGGVGGLYRLSCDVIPSMQGVRIQNSTDPTQIGANLSYDENIMVQGPAEISAFITNNAATSTACTFTMSYIDTRGR
jgi:hypothetical protein